MKLSGSPLFFYVKRFRRGLILAALLFVSSLTILFTGTPGVQQPQQIGLSLIGFVDGIISGTLRGVGSWSSSLASLADLNKNYHKALADLERYQGTERQLVQLQEENERLREQLGFHNALTYTNLTVSIIAKDPSRAYSSFIIDKGYLEGIRKDMPVIAVQDGVVGLVGKIIEVGLSSSVVQPTLDANLYIAARLENTRFEGLVTGKGNNESRLMMSYVSKAAFNDVKVGDLVVTSGTDSLYPGELPIGRVRKVLNKEYQTSLELELDPILEFGKLEYLSVLKGVK